MVNSDTKPQGKKDNLVKTIARYASSNFYRQFTSLLNAFIRPKLLSPELYGLWHILILIPGYAIYTNLGAMSIMRYLIPYHKSRNEDTLIEEIKSNVIYGTLATKLLIAVVLLLIAVFSDMSLKIRVGLVTMAFVVILEWYYYYYVTILQSYHEFKLISSANYLKPTVTLITGALLIYFFNIYGVYATAVLSLLVVILYLRSQYRLSSHKKFNLTAFISLVKKGFPIMLMNVCTTLISSVDKIIIAGFLETRHMGYYGIAIMVHHVIMNVPVASRDVMDTRLMQNIDKLSREEVLRDFFFKPLVNTAYFMPFLAGTVIITLPAAITLLLPRYAEGVVASQILVLGCYFFALSFVARGLIVANQWQFKISKLMTIALIINITVSIFLLKSGFGISGVAAGSSLSLFFYLLLLIYFLKEQFDYAADNWKICIPHIIYPFAVMILIITLSMFVSHLLSLNIYAAAFMELSALYIIMFVLNVYVSRRNPLLTGIKLKGILQKK
jgi:O-antigen/teichoic acid export membrane protein